ncbi:nuclear transport factor 2 family protein [Amycolatopsis taiwanensis]|uniref:nuclear transport factor 2 family protein n=1 Tax=Amycolatopsis taiwanensis TaxID=342230 RepID=UPI0004B659F7|nr:limonene-1,2-epoxide hydrolase family protein [Amycolatopsis taiwanensis]
MPGSTSAPATGPVLIHHTTDPDVIVVEYELVARVENGPRGAARFIGVLTARDGRIVHWREYQNVLAMAEAMSPRQ